MRVPKIIFLMSYACFNSGDINQYYMVPFSSNNTHILEYDAIDLSSYKETVLIIDLIEFL